MAADMVAEVEEEDEVVGEQSEAVIMVEVMAAVMAAAATVEATVGTGTEASGSSPSTAGTVMV